MINEIIHGDCMNVFLEIPSYSVDMVLTDIPYGAVTQNGEERAKYTGQMRKINKETADVITFDLTDFLDECSRVCKGSIYIFCGIEQLSTVFTYFYQRKSEFMTRQCAWKKSNPAPSNGQHMWLSSMENCVFAKRRKSKFNRICKSSVWEYPIGQSKIHPTEKSLKLFEYLIESSTDAGDLVLDPCLGSGTTALAALNLGRKFIGIELDEEYFIKANERVFNGQSVINF